MSTSVNTHHNWLRRSVATVAIFATFNVMAFPASAQSALEKLKKAGAVVGLSTEPPWSDIKQDGSMGGAMPEMDIAILKVMGVNSVKGEFMEFGALIPSLLSKRTDLNSSLLYISPARCEAVIFAKPSTCNVETLIVNVETAGAVNSYADIAAKSLKIALIPGSKPAEWANEAGVQQSNRIAFHDYVDAMKLLKDGRVDVVPAADSTAADIMPKFGDPAKQKVVPLQDKLLCGAASFRKDDTELRDAYNVAFEKLLRDGTIKKILDKYDLGYTLDYIDTVTTEKLCSTAP
ncbi:ectoine/hydroxyectoine ABC transporter substrate-binding protein EhuB 1 (plasmid) [Rhizobium gallicum]|uniref:Ectoine/hydroxyectoine ABC transporter substrate-binding protein EhuB 1 n=1 Tax=Rhizobium gallicum TaxID=56730 RepID=A0A1L5NPS4_9HYPH|nr:transporter substrate-binding domain-containing protein [Rhizobium gallicum]APO69829.1 ectoine/hydroxyectoine ABC transporter substrate-binding protein EhuB 1 [Rhizobium gallicum]